MLGQWRRRFLTFATAFILSSSIGSRTWLVRAQNSFTANDKSNSSGASPSWNIGDNVTITWDTWYTNAKLAYLPSAQDTYYTIYTIPDQSHNSFTWKVNVSKAKTWSAGDPVIYLGVFDSSGESFISLPVNVLPQGQDVSAGQAGSAPTAAAASKKPPPADNILSTGAIIGISLSGAVGVLAIVFAILMLCRRRIDRWAVTRGERREREALMPTPNHHGRAQSVSAEANLAQGLGLFNDRKIPLKKSGDGSGDYGQPPHYDDTPPVPPPKKKLPNGATVKVEPIVLSARTFGPLDDFPVEVPPPQPVSGGWFGGAIRRWGTLIDGRRPGWGRRAELQTVEKPVEIAGTELFDMMLAPGSPGMAPQRPGHPVLAWARSQRQRSRSFDPPRQRKGEV